MLLRPAKLIKVQNFKYSQLCKIMHCYETIIKAIIIALYCYCYCNVCYGTFKNKSDRQTLPALREHLREWMREFNAIQMSAKMITRTGYVLRFIRYSDGIPPPFLSGAIEK